MTSYTKGLSCKHHIIYPIFTPLELGKAQKLYCIIIIIMTYSPFSHKLEYTVAIISIATFFEIISTQLEDLGMSIAFCISRVFGQIMWQYTVPAEYSGAPDERIAVNFGDDLYLSKVEISKSWVYGWKRRLQHEWNWK